MLSVYRRHRASCKYADDRASKRCRCTLWATGSVEGEPIRRSLKTRNWDRAEQLKREIEARSKSEEVASVPSISEAIKKFMLDAEHGRKIQPATLKKYKVLLSQLELFADSKRVSKLKDITVDFAREFRASWRDGAISSSKKLERLRSFLRFCVLPVGSARTPQNRSRRPSLKLLPRFHLPKRKWGQFWLTRTMRAGTRS